MNPRAHPVAKRGDWSLSEIMLLKALKKKGVSYAELAACLPRHTQDAIRQQYHTLTRSEPHWTESENLAFFDIETSGFEADAGILLSWAIKYRGGEVKSMLLTKKDITSGKMDERLVAGFLKEIEKVDVLVGYYSTKFDMPFMRTRALMLGMKFPEYGEIMHHDAYYTARFKMKLHSNRLDSVAQALGCHAEKTPVKIRTWMLARYGDKKALDYVLEHNEADVHVLEEVFEKLLPFIKMQRKSA